MQRHYFFNPFATALKLINPDGGGGVVYVNNLSPTCGCGTKGE